MTEPHKSKHVSENSFWKTILGVYTDKNALTFIEHFFRVKDANLDLATLNSEAQLIAKVFPYYSVEYIAGRLQVLGNERNRIAVVLRQLLTKQGKSKASREANLKDLEKYCTEEAYAKAKIDNNANNNDESDLPELETVLPCLKEESSLKTLVMNFMNSNSKNDNKPMIENMPSTSKDCTINKPCTPTKSTTVVSSTSNMDVLCEAASLTLPKNFACEIPNSPDKTIKSVVQSSTSDCPGDTVQETIENVVKSYSGAINTIVFPHKSFKPIPLDLSACCSRKQKDSHEDEDEFRQTVIKRFNCPGLQVVKQKKTFVLKPSRFNLPVTITTGDTLNAENLTNDRNPESINLVEYLKELFPERSEQDVYMSCLHHNVDVNKLPEDSVFDLLVQDLSSKDLSTKENDVKENNDKHVVLCTDENVQFIEQKDNDNEEDNAVENPPAAKKAKKSNSNNELRFRIVKDNDSNERRFVPISQAYENTSSLPVALNQAAVNVNDSDDSLDDTDQDDMDIDTDNPMFTDSIELDVPTISYDGKLLSKLMEIFPDACPMYMKRLCTGKTYSHEIIDEITNHIFSITDYPKRQKKSPSPERDWDPEKQLAILKEILPDADPNFLQYHAELYINNQEKLKKFISNAIEKQNYPTMKEYLRKQQLSAQEKQYTSEFKVEKFLEVIPDPKAYFNDPQRKAVINNETGDMTYHYAFRFLKNMYLSLPIRLISSVFAKNNYNLTKTKKDLDEVVTSGSRLMKTKRRPLPITDTIQNIPFLQELAYLQHETVISEYIKKKEESAAQEKEKAKAAGLLQTCNCCYDEEVMPNCIMTCENGCAFCKTCIQKSVEIAFGEGKLDFPCLGECNSHFSLQTLQSVLSPKLFSKMVQKKQLEEVKAAGIEDLETCPFCDFATIPAPGDKLFKCFNPECMKESCRECKEPSHIPLRCDEIEKDDDVKRRVYIENKMTEALLRVCYKCGLKFIKSDGCNKMTCSCGASMCYICGKPVTDYKHFNGQGGDQYHLCPLYSDTNQLHQQEVLKGAEEAKQEVGVNEDPSKLKIDPTADVQKHYEKERKRHPYQLPPGMPAGNVPHRRDGIYFHVGVRVNQNHVQFDHVHQHHHHHHHHHHDHPMQPRHPPFL